MVRPTMDSRWVRAGDSEAHHQEGMGPIRDGDDAPLVRAAQQGDTEAFGLLVSRHASAILTLANRMLAVRSDAEDVAQDTFVAAYEALPRFQFGAKFSSWLYGIAVNKCRDRLRAKRPDLVEFDEEKDSYVDWPGPSGDWTPDGAFEQGELAGELDRAVQALPAHYREAFVLRHIEGLEYRRDERGLGHQSGCLEDARLQGADAACALRSRISECGDDERDECDGRTRAADPAIHRSGTVG